MKQSPGINGECTPMLMAFQHSSLVRVFTLNKKDIIIAKTFEREKPTNYCHSIYFSQISGNKSQ